MHPETTRPSGPTILAGVGVTLLLVAAISVVSDRWDLMGPGGRLAVLLTASAVVLGVTVPLRRIAPGTARALDVLTAALVAVDTAAVAVAVGGSWRTALVAAGPATVLAAEGLHRRGHRLVSAVGTYGGGVLAVAGVAASFDVAGAVVLAALALVAVTTATDPIVRSVAAAWAVTAGLTPALRVIDEVVFTGMGTSRDMGLIDPAPIGQTVAISLVAASALGVWGRRDRTLSAVVLAPAVVIVGGLDVWATLDPPPSVGLLIVTTTIGLIELALVSSAWGQGPRVRHAVERTNEVLLGALTLVVVAVAWSHIVDGGELTGDLALTAAAAAATWVIGDVRRAIALGRRGAAVVRQGGEWDVVAPGFVAALGAAVYLATEAVEPASYALAGVALALVIVDRPYRDLTALVTAGAAMVLAVETELPLIISGVGAAVTGSAIARGRMQRTADDPVGAVAVVTALTGGMVAALGALPTGREAAGIVLLVAWWSAGAVLHRADAPLGWTLRALALGGIVLTGAGDHWTATAVALAVVALGLVEWRRTEEDGHGWLAIGALALAWPQFLNAIDVDLVDLHVVPLLWLGAAVAVSLGVHARAVRATALALTVVITVIVRIVDPAPLHLAVLGICATAAAVWAARDDDVELTGLAGGVAAAAAVFELLDHAIGVETWGWLVVGGAAALTAAGLIEGRGGRDERAPSVF